MMRICWLLPQAKTEVFVSRNPAAKQQQKKQNNFSSKKATRA